MSGRDGIDAPGGEGQDAVERAHDQYVDALLERALGTVDDRAAIERALAGFDRAAPQETRSTTPAWRGRLWPAAAAVLATLAVAFLTTVGPAAPTAEATLAEAIEVAQRPQPRAYAVEVSGVGPLLRTIEINLFVEADRRVALHVRVPRSGAFWCGAGDGENWLVPPGSALPVFIAEQRTALVQQLLERGVELPHLDVVSALVAFQESFDVTLEADGRTLHGVRRADADDGPDRFRLELDEDHELIALTLDRDVAGSDVPRRFELRPRTEPVDPKVFERTTHHGPERRIRRL